MSINTHFMAQLLPNGSRSIFLLRQRSTPAEPGWIVLYGGNIIAVLQEGDDGKVFLYAGFEHPYTCTDSSWTSLTDAKADFSGMARLYRMGIPPATIGRFVDHARRLKAGREVFPED